MSEIARCVLCARERAAQLGLLCEGHYARLAAMLRDVEDEAIHLDARPSMQQRIDSGKGSLASERAPVRLTVVAMKDPRTRRWEPDTEPRYVPPPPKSVGPWCLFCDHETCTNWRAGRRRDLHDDEHDAGSATLASVLDELHNWARLVREERDLAAPEYVTVTGERDALTRNLDWIAEQSWVDECYTDMRTLLSRLQSVNNTAPERPVGRCYLPAEDGPCNGPIWMDAVNGQASCGRCGAAWDGPQLAMLNYEMERAQKEAERPRTDDGRPMLTAEEIAERHGLTVNAVYLRMSRAKVRAVHGHFDPALFSDTSVAS